MKRSLIVCVILLATVSFADAKMKAQVGYDKNTDFGSIKTFAYFETLETSVADTAPPVHEMIKIMIINRLKKSGLREVSENPDVYVTYHTDEQQAMGVNVTMYQYHYSAGWWWSPLWGSGIDVSSYSQGTLVIDIWRPDTEELIWRGAVVGVIPDNPSPQKAQDTIEKALNKIGKEWQKQVKKAR